MQPLLTIVVPTFNEADNVAPFVEAVTAAFRKEHFSRYELLFVDDSADHTPHVIRSFIEKYAHIRLIHRPKEERTGLATAFVTAFHKAQGEYICCIDSDLQHPPEFIPQLWQALVQAKADIAVASRYIRGGSAEGLKTFFRKAVSKVTKYVSHLVLSPARNTSDPGSGFFIFKKHIISDVDLSPQGFKILLEVLVRGTYNKVIDVAYTFRLRVNEESKATMKQGIAFLKHLGNLFWTVPAASRMWRFMIVGFLGTVLNLAILFFCTHDLGLPIKLGWLFAVIISIATNFFLNNSFTFPEHKATTRRAYIQKCVSYTIFSFLTLGINYLFFSAALSLHIHYIIAAVIGIVAAFISNFFLSKHVVWSPTSYTTIFSKSNIALFFKYAVRTVWIFVITYILAAMLLKLTFPVFTVSLIALLLSAQGLFSLYTMIYTWEDHRVAAAFRSPTTFTAPGRTFSAILAARHEQQVIGPTLRAIDAIDYPTELKEIIVVCRSDDTETIKAAQAEMIRLHNPRIRLIQFDGFPINKPHALNLGLSEAAGDIITIFDAEDEPHPNIYSIINTLYDTTDADVIQSGVQLMNHRSNWYSFYNVLEYFFWFKSSLHLFSRLGLTPLGGNTVFFKQGYLRSIDGWDEDCLTEDADVGIRLCLAGAKIRIVYDEAHVTQEETPPTLGSFIKQRTRWNQGFVQILLKGDWKKLPTLKQRLLALYILAWPIAQSLLFIYTVIALIMAFILKMPPLMALVTNLPLYIFALFLVVYNVGLYEFTRGYGKRYHWYDPILSIVFFLPFQFILGLSAFRAVYRIMRGHGSWEKTAHTNAHRPTIVSPEIV